MQSKLTKGMQSDVCKGNNNRVCECVLPIATIAHAYAYVRFCSKSAIPLCQIHVRTDYTALRSNWAAALLQAISLRICLRAYEFSLAHCCPKAAL